MKRRALPLLTAAAAVAAFGLPAQAVAAEKDRGFFRSIEGEWSGPGEIVAGKYKGTKFTCTFTGAPGEAKAGMSLDGSCRVGVLSQKMSARIEAAGRNGYAGTFMDGAAGQGLDVVAGRVDGRKVTLSLSRNKLQGAMLARLPDENTMTVTVSVRVADELVPVIGMNLKRIDTGAVGSIARQ